MNWDDLRYALAVSELGSLSAAADSLEVNASTVLRRIAALEKSLGVRLFERDRTGYRVTQEGGALMASLRPIQERISGIARSFIPEDEGAESILRMSAPAALGSALIAPRLGQFRASYPGLTVDMQTTHGAAPVKLGMLDLALSYGRPVSGDMVVRKLADIGYGLYASPELLSRHADAKQNILAGLPLIGFAGANPLLAPVEWLDKAGNESQAVLRTDDANCRFSSVVSGVGASVLPCFLADQAPGISRIYGPETVGRVELWLATHRETRHVSRMRVLVDFLVKLTRDRRLRLAGDGK